VVVVVALPRGVAPVEPAPAVPPILPLVVALDPPGPTLVLADPPAEPEVELLPPDPPALPPEADCA
jgi:hypothetical protein